MNVGQLIEELKKHPAHLEVMLYGETAVVRFDELAQKTEFETVSIDEWVEMVEMENLPHIGNVVKLSG